MLPAVVPGNNTVVLCVMIQAGDIAKGVLGSTANIRFILAGGGSSSVSVHDRPRTRLSLQGWTPCPLCQSNIRAAYQLSHHYLHQGAGWFGRWCVGDRIIHLWGRSRRRVRRCRFRALSNRLACDFPLRGYSCAQATAMTARDLHVLCCGQALSCHLLVVHSPLSGRDRETGFFFKFDVVWSSTSV
jgi:hypothetical protein